MTGSALSERDLTVLRSFARRIDPADPGAHNNLGVLYYQKGLVPEAIEEFLRALELDPRMQVAQENLEIAYNATGYYDRRVAELRERLRREPYDLAARWELGRTCAALGHAEEAAAEFEQILARHPEDVAALLQLGLAERGRGNLEAATAAFERARALDPHSSVTLFYYGEALYHRGLSDSARVALEEAVQRNPDNADAYYLLGFVYGDLGEHERARAATSRATQLNPTLARAQSNLSLARYDGLGNGSRPARASAPRPVVREGATLAHYNLGLAFRQKGYYVEALREYRMALDAGEDARLVRQAMAEVHLLRRDIAAALELYDALLAEDPASPKLWNERGVCLQQGGRRDEATMAYEQAIATDPQYALAWNNLGVLRSQLPESEESLEAFQQALHLDPTLTAARLNLALALFHRRRFQLSLEAYRQALADHPQNAVAWNGVGLVLVELKRFEDAKHAFSRAVEADAGNASAHYNLSFSLSHLGDFDGALRATKRALELEPFYVPQKYSLTIDLQYEHPDITIVPQISADVTADAVGGDFHFDERLLDRIFDELQPSERQAAPSTEDPLALAADYIQKGFLEHATAQIERALARGTETARATTLLAEVFARRGLHGEALERFRAALRLDAAQPRALLGEIRALLALGRGADALEQAEQLLQHTPEDVDGLVAVARVRLAAGLADEARVVLRQARVLEPGRPDLLQLEAAVCEQLDDLEAAVEACHAALQLDGAVPQVWRDLGRLEERRENWVGARVAYQRALDLLPTYMEAALAMGDLLRRTESPQAAVDCLVEVLLLEPWDLEALLLLARALLEDSRPEQALEAVDLVLKFVPDHDGALFHRGVALARVRRYGEAVQAWERVVQVEPTGPFAQAARTHARSARDLAHIFAGAA
ncbi:MAG TPA: tetratricopeptide repeat protein [Gemmatimonadales bacterium]|nr:tetratricopeptide repeat protein [Gemmatimonadales bacterium]